MDEVEAEALIERIRAFARERTPSLAAGRAVVGVSGGADSAATLALLCEAGVVDPRRSAAAHFDHGLRGDEAAARDRAAVEALCARYGMPLVIGSWAAPRRGEAAAREARYAFLGEVARMRGIGVIVTGHTADDQAETVVLQAARGAGLHGLRGVGAEVRRATCDVRGEIVVVRPLLCVAREETRGFCGARGIAFVDDATNEDRALARNRVRLEVLPALETERPGSREALLRLADDARAAVTALEGAASRAIVAEGDEAVVLSRTLLRAMPEELAPYAYRLAIERLTGGARDIGRKHYAALGRAAWGRTGSVLELPHGVTVVVEHEAIVVSLGVPTGPVIPESFEAAVPFEGVVGAWRLRVVVRGPACATGDGVAAEERGDRTAGGGCDPSGRELVLPAGAVVRRRRAGDRMRLLGGTRKLQDVFVDLKVPRRERDGAPVIAVGGEVLWTPYAAGMGIGEGERFVVEAVRV